MEVALSEAAARLGVSVDTVRRRLKSGQLAGRQAGRRLLVMLPEPAFGGEPRIDGDLLAEIRAERDRLAAMVDALLRQLDLAAAERAELRALLERALAPGTGRRARS